MSNWVVANPVDTSKNLLHTYSYYAGIYNYLEGLDAWSGGRSIYSRLDNHIKILKKREEKFYQETLGLSGVTDFNTFIQKIRDSLDGVESFFYKLSSYDKTTSLRKYVINNLQLDTRMTSGGKGKSQLENFSGQTISQSLQNQIIDVEALLSKGSIKIVFTTKKDSSTKKEVDVLKLLKKELKDVVKISMLDFQEKIIPNVVKNLKSSLKGFNVSDSQLWGSLTSFLKEDIEKSIQDEVLRESFLRQVMQASAVENFLNTKKTASTKHKNPTR